MRPTVFLCYKRAVFEHYYDEEGTRWLGGEAALGEVFVFGVNAQVRAAVHHC
jgi:hypothetical protein